MFLKPPFLDLLDFEFCLCNFLSFKLKKNSKFRFFKIKNPFYFSFYWKLVSNPEKWVKFSGSIWFFFWKIQCYLVHLMGLDISGLLFINFCFRNKKLFITFNLENTEKFFFILILFENDFPTSTIDSWSWRTWFQTIKFEHIVQIKSYFQCSSIILQVYESTCAFFMKILYDWRKDRLNLIYRWSWSRSHMFRSIPHYEGIITSRSAYL
jgi:hypothetical protein